MSKKVKNMKSKLEAITKSVAVWSGLCLWIEGVAKDHKKASELISLGCRWSQKRSQWYWRYEEN